MTRSLGPVFDNVTQAYSQISIFDNLTIGSNDEPIAQSKIQHRAKVHCTKRNLYRAFHAK